MVFFGGWNRRKKEAVVDQTVDIPQAHGALPTLDPVPYDDGTKEVELKSGKSSGLHVKVLGKIPLPPKEVFDILTNPDNKRVFRSIKRVNYRKVSRIMDMGRRRLKWSMWVGGGLDPYGVNLLVRMNVFQDRNRGKIKFKLLKSSLMKDFSGEWTIEPYDKDSLDELVKYPGKKWGPMHQFSKAMHRFEESLWHTRTDSLVQLRQSVQPRLLPPPPLDRVLKQITLAQVRTIMQDLLDETHRANDAAMKNTRKQEDKKPLKGVVDILSFCRNIHTP
eukprot:jgi/Picre1/27535/NNA_000502.t1